MPKFTYRGRNTQGYEVKGKRNAASEEALADQLIGENITPIEILPFKETFLSQFKVESIFQRNRLQQKDIIAFFVQLYTLTKAGIPLDAAVKYISESSSCQHAKEKLQEVVQEISSGHSLSQSLKTKKLFSNLIVRLIAVGEQTGRLETVFNQIAEFVKFDDDTTKRMKSAFRYPIMVVFAVFSALIIINVFVIPSIASVFSRFDKKLPVLTKMILAISGFMVSHWHLLILATIFIIVGIKLFFRLPLGQQLKGKYSLRLPVVGRIMSMLYTSRFARTFSMIIRAGLPIDQAILLSAKSMDNYYIRDKILLVHDSLSRGEAIGQAIKKSDVFDRLVCQMIMVGEESGQLDYMLEQVSDYYDREVQYDLANLSELIEPILLLFAGGIVLILALGVFLPLWDITSFAKR